ncbi:hypothetical protein HMPREF3038_01231 [Akkermansia sp. KLE1797]|nr:hypothetical protein HMPREF3038_01231 [Akkermansia sp. KLE1797]KZA04177.1 hypothetical protein HMPREF1326_02100 [Akkermansia sp. KLE1605]
MGSRPPEKPGPRRKKEPRLSLAVKWQIPYSSICWKGRRDIVVTPPFLSYGRGNNTW